MTGPPHLLLSVIQRVHQLERLAKRCTIYQRHELIDPQGALLARRERGVPFVLRKGLGTVPIDPEDPFLDDGSVVVQITQGYTDDLGRWHRSVLTRRLPAPQTPRTVSVQGRARRADDKGDLPALLEQAGDRVTVSVRLRDREILPALPGRVITGLAFEEHHRSDTITPRRRRMARENQAKRRVWAAPLRAWLRSVGATVSGHSAVHASVIEASVPRGALKDLMARDDVVYVQRSGGGRPDESPDERYLCSGVPKRGSPSHDEGVCDGTSIDGPFTYTLSVDPFPFQDAVNAATGILDYVNAGYLGMVSGGNASWAELAWGSGMAPTLGLVVFDDDFLPTHPALQWRRESRVKAIIQDEMSSDDLDVVLSLSDYVPPSGALHGTGCLSIALSNAWAGTDALLSTDEERGARSGVARAISSIGIKRDAGLASGLDALAVGFIGSDGTLKDGVDVFSISYNLNDGVRQCLDYDCPTIENGRGLDDQALALNDAYFYENTIFAKSAGNMGGCASRGTCRYPIEVSSPGASAAAVTSGALSTIGLDAAGIQRAEQLDSNSSGSRTLDGRTYPLLVLSSNQCGVASVGSSSDGTTTGGYTWFYDTSATAPRVAGAATLIKHWYLEQYGASGMSAGRNIAMLLNFADGFALDTSSATPTRLDPPAPGWGLGRLRMRLFSDAQDSSGPHRGSASLALRTGSSITLDLGVGTDTGVLPGDIRHLRVTAWWMEVNTGRREEKAHIRMSLLSADYTTWPPTARWDVVETDQECVLRLQYDRDDEHFPCPPSGVTMLYVEGVDVPREERSPGRAHRTIYVDWFWETGEDPTEITCGADRIPAPCEEEVAADDPLSSDGPELLAARVRLDRAIVDTLRVAVRGGDTSRTGLVHGEEPC